MVDVAEHAYRDDPARGHPDVRTRLSGTSYFFLGNGRIQAAVQHAPAGEGTPLGLLVMDPDRLRPKRGALTMHPEHGLEPTALRIAAGTGARAPEAGAVAVAWQAGAAIPAVVASWKAGPIDVEERFSCPDGERPSLSRDVTLANAGHETIAGTLRTGTPGTEASIAFSLAPGDRLRAALVYDLDRAAGSVDVRIAAPGGGARPPGPRPERTTVEFGDPVLDRLFRASAAQLPAAVSAAGRMDGSIWQYNREWVRDQAFAALALTMLGHQPLARTMLRRLAIEFVTEEGATLDSSQARGRGDVELDQNGILLHVLGEYTAWTGDLGLAEEVWDHVAAAAEYPLRAELRHPASGLLCGTREYWERHAAHGIKPGLELAHQLFVSLGLAAAASLARQLGRPQPAARWQHESESLRDAMLSDPVFALSDARGFVKRRLVTGQVQETILPSPRAGLPEGVPLAGDPPHRLNPDTSCVLPIAFGTVAPRSAVARATLNHIETLWNQAWHRGGYGRYHVSSEPDSPGAWPFASIFVARAAVEAGDAARAWRILRWLAATDGAASGAWFENNGPRASPPFPQVGITPWTWAELVVLVVQHLLGVRPGPDAVTVTPRLLPGLAGVEARLPVREGWLRLRLRADPDAPDVATFRVPCGAGETPLEARVRPMP
ncbi:MAG TPA: hypothetical protein PLE61_04165 [Vicinamibacterales bacterium]|mgnify:CR=1 FL=1|nr:hypothetical protein [Vicinamibacterales bacterium]HPW19989.1 hypothetical protein [Vicinamibacterales bacterium]